MQTACIADEPRPHVDELLTVAETARLARVTPRTVYTWCETELPSLKVGKCRRIRRGDLEEFFNRHRTVLVQDGDRLEVLSV